MNVKLDMPIGEYRELTKDEFTQLNKLLEDSTKTFKKTNKR
jgi:16S rRNA U516 pseudouridylate synthase RsuA-like enzyme